MRFLKRILIALLLVISSRAFAQVNLVLNPGFEYYTQCPTANDQINLAKYWSSIDSTGQNLYCIPDFSHSCAGNTHMAANVPNNDEFWQYAHGGNGLAKTIVFNDESNPMDIKRNYLQGRLSKKLIFSKSYCVSFYVCLAEACGYGIREISAYLDNGSIDSVKNCDDPQTRYIPQITYSGSSPITDTMRWTKIEGSFIANGTEQFITIGNFKDKAHTTYVPVPRVLPYSAAFTPERVGYLIDDVSVVESTTKAYAGPDTHVGYGDSVFIGRPDGAMDCSWTALGSSTVIGTGAGIWVKPAVTTSYVVTQTLCGAVTKDTVKVEVWKAGVTSVNGQTQQYTLSPNPNQGRFEITQSVPNSETIMISIIYAIGQQVYSGSAQLQGGKASLQIGSDVTPGLYYLFLRDAKGNSWKLRLARLFR